MADNLDDRLKVLKMRYVASFLGKADSIEKAWQEYCDQSNDSSYKTLYTVVHNLSGSAGLYDCANVMNASQQLINQLKNKDTKAIMAQSVKVLVDILRQDYRAHVDKV